MSGVTGWDLNKFFEVALPMRERPEKAELPLRWRGDCTCWECKTGRMTFLRCCGWLSPVLAGKAGKVCPFSQNFVKFQDLGFFWEPKTWQTRAVLNSGVSFSWIDAFGIIHQESVCRTVEGLRLRFPWDRQLIGKRKNAETSLVFEISQWRISREATCNGNWRSWGVGRLRTSLFYTDSVPSLFKW
jgi:hypothetical protein